MSAYIRPGLWLIYTARDSGIENHRFIEIISRTTSGDLDKVLREDFGEHFVIKNMVKVS